MKALNIFLLGFALVLMATVGVGFVCVATMPGLIAGAREAHQLVDGALQANLNLRWGLFVVGVIFLALAFMAVWGNISMRRWERTVVLHNPLGEVMISLAALEDIGRQARGDVAGVKDLKVKVLPHRRGLKATVRVVLYSDANVPSTTEAIQESVRQRLLDVVGEGQDIRPRVMVSKVVFRGPEDADDLLVYRPYGRARRPPRP